MKVLLTSILLLTGLAAGQDAGTLTLEPNAGPVGTRVTATVAGLAAGEVIELVWTSADADWNVARARSTASWRRRPAR